MNTANDRCPHCGYPQESGCRWGCPEKKPPSASRDYDRWAAAQKARWAYEQELHCRHCPGWAEELRTIEEGMRKS